MAAYWYCLESPLTPYRLVLLKAPLTTHRLVLLSPHHQLTSWYGLASPLRTYRLVGFVAAGVTGVGGDSHHGLDLCGSRHNALHAHQTADALSLHLSDGQMFLVTGSLKVHLAAHTTLIAKRMQRTRTAWSKLQALVYDILPSATAVFSYVTGSSKLG